VGGAAVATSSQFFIVKSSTGGVIFQVKALTIHHISPSTPMHAARDSQTACFCFSWVLVPQEKEKKWSGYARLCPGGVGQYIILIDAYY